MPTTEATSNADTTQQATSGSEPKPDHVVVFVHGMGEALKGGTLLEWSEPLIKSLHDIAIDNIEKNLEESHSDTPLQDPPALTIETAHTTQEVPKIYVSVYKPGFSSQSSPGPGFSSKSPRVLGSTPNENDPPRLQILLTEAHWAKDFTPSKASATWVWGLSVATRVWSRALNLIRWNLYPPPEIVDRPFLRGAWWIIPFFLIGAVSLPLLVLLLLMFGVLIGLSKIPGISSLAKKIVVLFANFLGDPATWNRVPTQAAAMRQKVIDIVEALPKNANVTIVAHSQGAAVAGQVVLSGRVKPTNFITVGSGLSLLGYAKYGANHCDDPVKEWSENARKVRWINVWGKFDFVPAGPMAEKTPKQDESLKHVRRVQEQRRQTKKQTDDRKQIFKLLFGRSNDDRIAVGPEEHPVFNRSAIIRDHIVYSQNRIEVIDPLARLIYDNEASATNEQQVSDQKLIWFKYPDPSLKLSENDERMRRARHRRLVSFLGMARILAICAGFFFALPLTRLTQFLLGSDNGSFCGPAVLRWSCIESDFLWRNLSIQTDWAILLAVSAAAMLLIWLLNGLLWTKLHERVERRRDNRGRPCSGGKLCFFWYSWAVILATVGLPFLQLVASKTHTALNSGIPISIYTLYLALVAILGFASWGAGRDIRPLAAKL